MMKKKIKIVFTLISLLFLASCRNKSIFNSPSGNIALEFKMNESGRATYNVTYNNKEIIRNSKMGFTFAESPQLLEGFEISNTSEEFFCQRWKPVWGEKSEITNQYTQVIFTLKEQNNLKRELNIWFRIFNDGVAFRYEFPKQENLTEFKITDELTEFNFAENFSAWWTVADYDTYEKTYQNTQLKEVSWAATPITLEANDGVCVAIHEAALTNFAGMTFKQSSKDALSFTAALVPYADSTTKVIGKTPLKTPWRTIQIVPSAAKLLLSDMILNLNEPSSFDEADWIKPAKYIGIWWEMHLGLKTWHADKRHGANTKRTMKHIDFAKENNINAVLIEGWNTGWEDWGKPEAFDFITAYKDFDLPKLAEYAKVNNVELIGHHETGGDYITYEKYLDSAFSLYNKLGIKYVKTGYAGAVPNGEHHHGQIMVNHYRKVVETAAKYKIMIDAHEPIKPTGIRRTFPNMMTREGVRGMEWNAWSQGNSPEHTCVIPFTRGLGGPTDYTPGIFDIKLKNFENARKNWNEQHIGKTSIHTTLAKQLALWVVIYSPLQMAADMIENYEKVSAFNFFKDFNPNFSDTKVLNAKIGDYLTIVRKAGDEWFLGSITDENARQLEINFNFLDSSKTYKAQIYRDGKTANFKNNPTDYETTEIMLTSKSLYKAKLAEGGGVAMRIFPFSN